MIISFLEIPWNTSQSRNLSILILFLLALHGGKDWEKQSLIYSQVKSEQRVYKSAWGGKKKLVININVLVLTLHYLFNNLKI